MSSGPSSMSGIISPAELAPVDGNGYEAGRKAAWDREDFGSLFERHLTGTAHFQGAVDAKPSTAARREPDAGYADAEDVSLAGPSAGFDGTADSMSAESAVPLDLWAPAASGGGGNGAACAASGPDPETPLFDAQASSAEPWSAGSTAGAGMRDDDRQLTVHVAGGEASVWSRDPDLDAATAALLARDLRAQLSWRGVALTSFKLNGRALMPAHETAAERPDSSVFAGEETNHGR